MRQIGGTGPSWSLPEFEACAVFHVLQYIYMGDYNIDLQPPIALSVGSLTIQEPPLVQHVRVNEIANHFGLLHLAQGAIMKLKVALEQHWDALAFFDVAHAAWSASADKSLHLMLADLAAVHIDELLEHPRLRGQASEEGFDVLRAYQTLAKSEPELLSLRMRQLERARRQNTQMDS